MAKVLRDARLEKDTHVLLEYKLPSTEKRIDFLITGQDLKGKKNAMIIELKQWQRAKTAEGNGIVTTFLGKRERETVHPSYQASSYKRFLLNFNESFILTKPYTFPHARIFIIIYKTKIMNLYWIKDIKNILKNHHFIFNLVIET